MGIIMACEILRLQQGLLIDHLGDGIDRLGPRELDERVSHLAFEHQTTVESNVD